MSKEQKILQREFEQLRQAKDSVKMKAKTFLSQIIEEEAFEERNLRLEKERQFRAIVRRERLESEMLERARLEEERLEKERVLQGELAEAELKSLFLI